MEYCQQAVKNANSRDATVKQQTAKKIPNKCSKFNCDIPIDTKIVCGLRSFGAGFKVRLFLNECEMIRHNCLKNVSFAATDINVCDGMSLPPGPVSSISKKLNLTLDPLLADPNDMVYSEEKESLEESGSTENDTNSNNEFDSVITTDADLRVTAFEEIKLDESLQDGNNDIDNDGPTTESETETTMETEEAATTDTTTETNSETTNNESNFDSNTDFKRKKLFSRKHKNLIIVDATLFDVNGNHNDTIENFFQSTHVFDLPLKQVALKNLPETRRRAVNIFQPTKVFQPLLKIPENKSEDYWHMPTLSSCYHKCPMKCPSTYAPVCGVPGTSAREPSVMFMNHCFMDAAQCKMFWDNKSSTAESSAYLESSFMICLGDTLHTLTRFLPLVRTLQHMGRLKKKGKFHYKMSNMHFFNELLSRNPNIMGR